MFGETTRNLLQVQERPCSVPGSLTSPGVLRSAEMGKTSAGIQSRDTENGNRVHTRTV
ncbi:hypothetical protein KHU12_07500 [Pseudocitrobacter faecalis]